MRTTVRVDDGLLEEAKRYALETGRTLTAVIEDALRESLGRARRAPRQRKVRLTTFDGGGMSPGADLTDSASLRDLMDGL
jgi:hypothetical protein